MDPVIHVFIEKFRAWFYWVYCLCSSLTTGGGYRKSAIRHLTAGGRFPAPARGYASQHWASVQGRCPGGVPGSEYPCWVFRRLLGLEGNNGWRESGPRGRSDPGWVLGWWQSAVGSYASFGALEPNVGLHGSACTDLLGPVAFYLM